MILTNTWETQLKIYCQSKNNKGICFLMKDRESPGIILMRGILIHDFFFVQSPPGLAWRVQPGPVIACRLAIARNMTGTGTRPYRRFWKMNTVFMIT